MRRRLPPLTALRAFEAAARRLSLARAAEELYVTPAAVRHQIKALEEWLGQRLFVRHNGRLALTPSGHAYLAGIGDGLDKLWEATERISIANAHNTLSVVVPPSIASQWLLPRLCRYKALRPETELRVSVITQPIDFSQLMADIGITFGWDVAPELNRQPLMRYDIILVCSPVLLEGPDAIRVPADLTQHRLLQDEALKIHDRVDWRYCLEMLGVPESEGQPATRFNLATHTYQMAIEGGGVALAKSALVKYEMDEGRLVRLFDFSVQSDYTYDIVLTDALTNSLKVTDFCNWLYDEVERDGFSV